MPFDHWFLSKGIEFSVYFNSFFHHPSLLYQSMLLGGGGCWMSKCSFIILHCSVSHTDRTNTLPLLTPLGEDWFYTYIVFFFQEPRLSSFMSLPFHTFRKTPFNHSFLSKGIEFSAFFKNLFYHPSLLSQSMLLGGRGCCMPNFSFIILHCPVIPLCQEKTPLPLFTPLGGDWYYTYIYTYFSFKNLFYHPSLLYQPMLLGGVDVACQTVRLSSCIALSFHTTRESSYSTLIHPFAGFIDIFLSRNSSIILHSIYPCFWEGSGCCMPNSFFIILHCPVISNY